MTKVLGAFVASSHQNQELESAEPIQRQMSATKVPPSKAEDPRYSYAELEHCSQFAH